MKISYTFSFTNLLSQIVLNTKLAQIGNTAKKKKLFFSLMPFFLVFQSSFLILCKCS